MRALDRCIIAAGLVIAVSAGRVYAAELREVDVQRLQQGSSYPWQAVVSPDGAHVYAVAASLDRPEVFAFRRESDGAVMPIAGPTLAADDGFGRFSLAMAADGRHVYAGIGAEQIVVLSRDASTGSLTQIAVLRDVSRRLTTSPDGRNLYALFPALLVTYTRDQTTGLLTRTDLENGIAGPVAFDGALGLGVSPDGRHVYLGTAGTAPGAVGDATPSLIVFARDPSTGALEPVETIHDGENGVSGIALPSSVRVSPDGRHVYASGGSDDVAIFARDDATGKLTFVEVTAGGGFTSDDGDLVVSPDGERVVVAGAARGGAFARDGITIFGRDPRTGLLTWLETLIRAPGHEPGDLAGPTSVVFAPDGHDLYVTAGGDAALTAFRVLPHCSAEPAAGCTAGRSQIVVGRGAADTLLWTWRTGAASGPVDFGDPRTTTDFAFCLHREDAGGWANLLQLSLPAASTCGATSTPCWRTTAGPAPGGYVFRDGTSQHDGVTELRLTPRRDGRASILLRGRGAGLGLPALPLGPAERVVAQLRTGDGACWSADYGAPARRDDGGHFSDQVSDRD